MPNQILFHSPAEPIPAPGFDINWLCPSNPSHIATAGSELDDFLARLIGRLPAFELMLGMTGCLLIKPKGKVLASSWPQYWGNHSSASDYN